MSGVQYSFCIILFYIYDITSSTHVTGSARGNPIADMSGTGLSDSQHQYPLPIADEIHSINRSNKGTHFLHQSLSTTEARLKRLATMEGEYCSCLELRAASKNSSDGTRFTAELTLLRALCVRLSDTVFSTSSGTYSPFHLHDHRHKCNTSHVLFVCFICVDLSVFVY